VVCRLFLHIKRFRATQRLINALIFILFISLLLFLP